MNEPPLTTKDKIWLLIGAIMIVLIIWMYSILAFGYGPQ